MQDILINWTPQETRVAVVEHGAVQDLHVERTLERWQAGHHAVLGLAFNAIPEHRDTRASLPADHGARRVETDRGLLLVVREHMDALAVA